MLRRFESFVTGITVCYKAIQRIKASEMTEFGLKGAHTMCLFFLRRYADGLTAAQLCRLCAEDKAAISRALATLREKGYATSEGSTYRAKWRLTGEGEAVVSRIDTLITQWVGFGGDGLTEAEREAFYNALDVIVRNLSETAEESGAAI